MGSPDDHTVKTLSAAAGEGHSMDAQAAAGPVAQKCKRSQIINLTIRLHKKTASAELLHQHGRDALAASTNMWHLIPC